MSKTYDDAELGAYLAGEMSPEEAAQLEAALEHDADLEARLLSFEALAAPLQSVFETLPDAARLPDMEDLATGPKPAPRQWLPFGLVAGVAGLIGVVVASLFAPERDLTWQEQVAVYQALYVKETVAPVSPTPVSLNAEFDRASEALGVTLSPEDYAALPGLTLKRSQVLGFEGAPLIQIAFASETGAPIAFCILRTDETEDAVVTQLSGLPTVHWSQGGFGYMLIGDLPTSDLKALAQQLGATL